MINSAAFWCVLVAGAVVYWALPWRRAWFLTLASAVYLATVDWKSVAAMMALSLLCFYAAPLARRSGKARGVVTALVAVTLVYLGVCKYVPALRQALASGEPRNAALLVPLGASYFTFKLIHYVIETGRNTVPPHGLDDFLSYMTCFPIYPAGPIERFEAYLRDRAQRPTLSMIGTAGSRIVCGLIKKSILVDVWLAQRAAHDGTHLEDAIPLLRASAPLEHLVKHLATLHPLFVWQFVLNAFFTAYIDFSAYSDIAIGGALLFGIRCNENFDWPILAPNIGEFWKRWHMSLSNFCQRYVYLPTMARTRSPYLAIYLTMTVMGLWHGASIGFLLWGLYHATLLAAFLTWGRVKRRFRWKLASPVWSVAGCALTVLLAAIPLSFTASAPLGVRAGLRIFAALFNFHPAA